MGRKAGHDHPRLFGPVKMRCKSTWTIGANEASMRRIILFIATLLPVITELTQACDRSDMVHGSVQHVKRGNRAFNLGCAPVP